jgi:SPP1 gp7 family putative phage head morphogenesis protein
MPIPRQRLVLDNVIGVRQFERGLQLRVRALLRAAYKDVTDMLARDYPNLTKYQQQKARAFYSRMEAMLTDGYTHVDSEVEKQLAGLARVQGKQGEAFLRRMLTFAGTSLDVDVRTTELTREQLRAIVNYPVEGLVLGDWWKAQGAKAALDVQRNVQLGLLNGESIAEIVRNRLGIRASVMEDRGAFQVARRGAEMIVRTATTSVQAQAHLEVFSAQPKELTDQYEYHATLDDRTTIICASLDGSVWEYDDPKAPKPPQHLNCRSTILPVINWERMGVTPPEKIVGATRSTMDGPVKNQTYEQWLRKQPVSVQNEVLGASRARLFRDGEVTLKQLLDSDGTVLTLDQLERKLGL